MIRKLSWVLVLAASVITANPLMAQKKAKGKAKVKEQTSKLAFTTDPATGVIYHFFRHNKKGEKPVMGDFVNIVMVNETDNDSVIFDSRIKGGDSLGTVRLNLRKTYNGCLEQGITMMAVGDSAAFKIDIDSVFKSFHMRSKPAALKSYKYFVFIVKLEKFQTEKEIMEEMQQIAEKKKAEETASITKYLKDSNLHVTPTADSLFILKHDKTQGTPIAEGDSVYVKYVGKLLDGKVFDKSDHGGNTPPTFNFIYTHNMPLIKGWIEMLGMMREGEKATILVPSSLAYGPRQMGPVIAPYSPLVFDLEVVKVKANK